MGEKKRKAVWHSSLTLGDVARQAGVSPTTVSFVLNEGGSRNKHVSEETRARVLQAVQELQFRPNTLARTLGKGRSKELIRIMDITLTLAGIELDNSFQQRALLHGYTPVMYISQGLSIEQRKELYRSIFDRRPLALYVSPATFTTEDVMLARKAGIEHIIFFRFRQEPAEQTHSIVFPCFELGRLAAQHLLEHGYRRLALVRPYDPIHYTQEVAFLERLEGMRSVIVNQSGVTLDILPLCLSTPLAERLVETTFMGADHPTGIYAFNDEYAMLLLGSLIRHGINVPQEVGIIGTDNVSAGAFFYPSLTTISFDEIDMGKRAVELFHTLHQGLPLPEELTRPLVPCLIQRESTPRGMHNLVL